MSAHNMGIRISICYDRVQTCRVSTRSDIAITNPNAVIQKKYDAFEMPRPKRARVTPSAPVNIAPRRAAAADSKAPATRSGARKPLTNISNLKRAATSNSDSSDAVFGTIKNAPKGSRRQGGGKRDESAMMAGAIGEIDLQALEREDEISDKAGSTSGETARSGPGRTTPNVQEDQAQGRNSTNVEHQNNLEVPESPRNATIPTRNTSAHPASPMSRPDYTQQAPPSAQPISGTPGGEISILAMQNWKRRPRQRSIVRTVQQISSDLDDSFDLPLSDDFEPDDLSTPLRLAKMQEKLRESEASGRLGTASPIVSSSNSRKRKRSSQVVPTARSVDSDVPSSPPRQRSASVEDLSSDIRGAVTRQMTAADEDARVTEREQESSLTPLPSDIQAPPQSSSPIRQLVGAQQVQAEPSPERARIRTTTRTAKRPQQESKAKRLTTAELTSLLPQRRQGRRRRGARNQAEIEPIYTSGGSSAAEDSFEREAKEPASRPRRSRQRPKATAIKQLQTTTPGRKAKPHTKGAKSGDSSAAVATLRPSRSSAAVAPARTYGRSSNGSSDKENEDADADAEEGPSAFMQDLANGDGDGDDDPPQPGAEEVAVRGKGPGTRKGKGAATRGGRESLELTEVARKFAAVDEWEMEFESVETGGRSSSPWR
ncbi:MAG: hypothetical protein M1820_002891 [Bogoriella megaspora]|nr:MAG: hypothetical protein M1820_002891 [Bogoriella megaspora]